jgi:LmbE family N-acetylglucosaminyl deacetylase
MLAAVFGAGRDAALRILCIGAHSDDIEIGCGGTVLRLLAERPGCKVSWVVFSGGNGPREEEARASAAEFLSLAGETSVSVKAFRESYSPASWAEIKDAFEELRSIEPDVVFTHRRRDEHQDHRVLGELAWNTFRRHLILEYEIPKYEGDLETPNVFVPLSGAVAARKVDLLERHFQSQRARSWFRRETFEGLMTVRGIECNAPDGMAEAFHARKIVM